MMKTHRQHQHHQHQTTLDLMQQAVLLVLCLGAPIYLYRLLYPAITIKNPDEIAKMRVVGALAAQVLTFITPRVKAGVSTGEINDWCHDYIVKVQGAVPAPLGYRGFPKSVCTSLNDVVCHGIPRYDEVLRDGDILNIDVTVIKDGYHGDTSKMFEVGRVDAESRKLVADTRALALEERCLKPSVW